MPDFPEGFDQRWLWVDPAAPEPATYYGAVLRAEEIRHYVETYNLLIDRETFNEDNLKGASYTMSPHASEGWIIHDRGAIENAFSAGTVWLGGNHEPLPRKRNSRGTYYVVPPNSLAYIRLREILRIPFYMIGRHNLKIDYVYQGLLLGTGPQVDPGFIGQLYIPLHNLTNKQVDIYIAESFVSIDFVRTSPLRLEKGIPATHEEFYKMYKAEKRPINLEKVDKKKNLDAYLEGKRPSSSLGDLVPRVARLASDVRRRRLIEVGIFLTVLVFLATLLTTYFLHFDRQLNTKTDDVFKRFVDMQRDYEALQGQISAVRAEAQLRLSDGLKARSENTEKQVEALKAQIAALEREMGALKSRMESPPPSSDNTRPTPRPKDP